VTRAGHPSGEEETIMAERISLEDKTLYRGYSNHIQRYNFAAQYCKGRRILDAGCGSGYGSVFLVGQGAESVTAVDISDEALAEANRLYRHDRLRFIKGDVEGLSEITDLGGPFDVVVNLENIEHIPHPDRFLEGAGRQLAPEGLLVVSTPNGAITERDEAGNILNTFHVQEFSLDAFRELLTPHFRRLEFFGQWKTPERLARLDFEYRLFKSICDLYYSPEHRLGRALRKLLGKSCAPPPEYTGAGSSYPADFIIQPIDSVNFPWPPDVILAVCRP
jgi:SAM-dependent methyltransferase